MAETACSDTAYLGYEYPAFAGHSFADTLANHRPRYPVVLDAPTANEISLATINGSNDGNNNREGNPFASSSALGSTGGSIDCLMDGNSYGQGHAHANNNNDSHDISHGVDNEDDIEVDNLWDGEDSTFGDGSSYGDSVLSDIMRHRYENGRRYHSYKEGRYLLPNDEEEMDREDMKHHMNMLLMEGRLHLAPIAPKPTKILDVGTGTGIWAIEMGELYPTAEVIGTDLSPIQPTWIPPNVRFEIDDVEEDWLYQPNSFDFVHFRFLFLAIKNLPRALDQAMRTLKPGGYIELCELDIFPVSIDGAPVESYSEILAFINTLNVAALGQGCDVQIAPKFKDLAIHAGYEDVTEEVFTVPWGSWPRDPRLKEAGAFLRAELRSGLQGICMGLFTRSLGWSAQEVELFLIGVRKDLDNNRLHLCSKLHCVYGRKPLHA